MPTGHVCAQQCWRIVSLISVGLLIHCVGQPAVATPRRARVCYFNLTGVVDIVLGLVGFVLALTWTSVGLKFGMVLGTHLLFLEERTVVEH